MIVCYQYMEWISQTEKRYFFSDHKIVSLIELLLPIEPIAIWKIKTFKTTNTRNNIYIKPIGTIK